ncbi:acyl carrier protein [Streptomyces sp. BA2]|uniref:acyl carrier protein n=1 Tax=Streptomyces sp. BA2 TaxID=436595 RepID=UPI00132408A3|nr:acyl carrier protein [Streptomyces sp. BA2]MWA08178.1 hypothetical protein [Streptomyces sp. BA2]
MASQPLEDRIVTMLREHFEIEEDLVRPEATFAELDMDSLAMAEMLAILEDEEGVPMPASIPGIGAQTTLAEGAPILAQLLADARALHAAQATASIGAQPGSEQDGARPLIPSTDTPR